MMGSSEAQREQRWRVTPFRLQSNDYARDCQDSGLPHLISFRY